MRRKKRLTDLQHFMIWVGAILLLCLGSFYLGSYQEVKIQSHFVDVDPTPDIEPALQVEPSYPVYIHDAEPWKSKCQKAWRILKGNKNFSGAYEAYEVLDQ